ncbi:TIGR01244 family phosphatase [Halomonas sediminis]|uniref:TIGR01244 family phosphatase n=1 Tax=Vreelandella zhuhanensis TaxID=2684210 RepID=A0A7X3GZS3_9GAMM|nr:TIGR01244 family sulfur transferase [Halomonas zhuhanensis]MWJ27892.1 TIGR01244 family phosphatase [Halomonas zhuhanensis]
MDIKPLDERLSVMAQPSYEDIDTLAKEGYRTIISNRPRGETEDQPDMQALKEKAESLGMVWREIPVKPGEYSQQDIDAFSEVLQSSPEPIVGFCRTGKRVSHLWAYSQAPECPIMDLMKASQAAGHDLDPLKDDLHRYAEQNSLSRR